MILNKSDYIDIIYSLHIPERLWQRRKDETLDDFIQYCYLQLLELPDEKFASLLEQGKLTNYFYILCKRQAANNSHFWSEYAGKIDYDTYAEDNDLERQIKDDFE